MEPDEPQYGSIDDYGEHWVADARAMILDTATLGQLREMLVARLEPDKARFVMNGLGYTEGWRIADRLLPRQPAWQSDYQLGLADVARLCGFGHARLDSDQFNGPVVMLEDSGEALDYRLQHELTAEPVCHIFAGFVRGYLSRLLDRPVTCLEYRCLARAEERCGFSVGFLPPGLTLTGDDADLHQQVIALRSHRTD